MPEDRVGPDSVDLKVGRALRGENSAELAIWSVIHLNQLWYTRPVTKSSSRHRTTLRQLHQARVRLLRLLGQVEELAIGTVSVVRRKCGKSGCHCAQDAGHPQTLFLYRGADGRRHCKLVRRRDEERLLRASRRYRAVRVAFRELRAINQREERILVAQMKVRALKYK